MYEKPLASEEVLILPLIRRSKKGTKLNLPEYFDKQLICSNQIEQRAILFQNQQCQKNILSENQSKFPNASEKNPSNSEVTTTAPAVGKLQKSFSDPSEKSLHMEVTQNALKAYPANSTINKANDKFPKTTAKKHNTHQVNKEHGIKDKHIFKSLDSIFSSFCQIIDQKPERQSSLLQLYPVGTIPQSLSASSEFQPLHKRTSSNFGSFHVESKATEALTIKLKLQDSKKTSGSKANKPPNDIPRVTLQCHKKATDDPAVPRKLLSFDADGKSIISKRTEKKDGNLLGIGCKECSSIYSPALPSVSSTQIIQMYDHYFKELGIEPEGLKPINKHF